MTQKILVTGSSGVIGTRLCEVLIEKGYAVVPVDWKPNTWNKDIDAQTVCVDLRDAAACKVLPKDVDFVIHLAANATVTALVKDPALAHDNIKTVYTILEHCRVNSLKLIFASSREVYGDSEKEFLSETDASIDNCENPYTASKIAGEALVRAYHKCYNMDHIMLRFSNVYGNYDASNRVIPTFIRKMLAGEDITIFGKDKLIDFTHSDDVVHAMLLSMEHFERAKNDVYNIAYGESTPLPQLVEKIKNILNTDVSVTIADNRVGEITRYVADIAKAKQKLNYAPTIDLEAGLQKTIEWHKTNGR